MAAPRHEALSRELLPDAPVFLHVEGSSSTSLALRIGVSTFHSAGRPEQLELSWRRHPTTRREAALMESEAWQSELLPLTDASACGGGGGGGGAPDDGADASDDDGRAEEPEKGNCAREAA